MCDFGCSENFEVKEKNVRVMCYPVSWAPCCKTWLKLKVNLQVMETKMIACLRKEKNDKIFQSIFRVGVCALHTLGRHVVKHG